jgi:transposase
MPARLKKRDGDEIDNWLRRDLNVNLDDIAWTYNTMYKTVSERRRKLRLREQTGIDPRRRPGPAPAITPGIRSFCLWLILWDLELLLDEVADYIYLEFNVALSKYTVCRLWKATNIIYKKCHVVAGQRNEELIAAWNYKRRHWKAEQLVFLDESAFNKKTIYRRMGFAPIGVPPTVKKWLRSSTRWLVLPTYCVDGLFGTIRF